MQHVDGQYMKDFSRNKLKERNDFGQHITGVLIAAQIAYNIPCQWWRHRQLNSTYQPKTRFKLHTSHINKRQIPLSSRPNFKSNIFLFLR